MNTTTAPQRTSDFPDTLRLPSRDTRISLIDRLTLRIALRLILWSTRTATDRERHSLAHRALIDRERRELAYEREAHLAHRR